MDDFNKIYKKINKIPVHFIPIMLLAFFSINLLSLTLPLAMKKIYSSIILSRSVSSLRYLLIGALIALALESVMRKIKDSSSKWIASKYEHQLSQFLISKLLNSYHEHTDENNYIANLEKFNSISRITNFYSTRFYQLLIDLPFMLLFLYLIYIFGGSLVFVPVTISLLYIITILLVSSFYFNSREKQLSHNDNLMDQLTETLEKIHLVKAAGIEESQISKFRASLAFNTESTYISNKYQNIPKLISTNLSQLTLFSILIGGGYLMSNNSITFGEITACAMLGGRALSPIISIMNQFLQRKDIALLKSRLDEIAKIENQYGPNTPNFPEDINGTIELINLKYDNIQNHTTETISKTIPAGSFVYVDPTKFLSYKNVLSKISGKQQVASGKILIDNLDITVWNMNSLKGKIEYLSDQVSIYKGSIMENITFFNHAKIEHANKAAALTGLDELASQMPEGFETRLDSYATNYLSAAFMQRLNLTRSLVDRPRILILDRIDESMDEETLELFKWLLVKFKGTLTIIIASSNPYFSDIADQHLKDSSLMNQSKKEVSN